MRKHYFLLWMKETAFFLYFYHGIIFYSAELFGCAVNFKFYLNILIFLNIRQIKHQRSNIWIKKQPLILGSVVQRGFAKQLPEYVLWKRCSWKLRKINRKTPVLESFFNKVAGFWPVTLRKKRLQHRCFPVNFANFLRTFFFKEHLRWLLFVLEVKCQSCNFTSVLSITFVFEDFGHLFPTCFLQIFS